MKFAIIALVGALAIVGIFLVVMRVVPVRHGATDASALLRGYLAEGRDYRIYVGIPLDSPLEWKQAQADEERLSIEGQPLRYDDITSFLVVYPNGEVLYAEQEFFPLPEGVHFIEPSSHPRSDVLDPRELIEGQAYVKIRHERFRFRQDEPYYYSTTVQNISDSKIRVIKFAGFAKSGNLFRLNTITGNYFTADDFISWYGAPKNGWIPPGESVTDPHNYGGDDGYWVYYFETEDGKKFAAGARIP